MSVAEPTGCSTTSTITAKALTAVLGTNTAKTVATLKFTPTAGVGTAFATVELSGGTCAIAGLYKLTGTVFSQGENATGVFAAEQEFLLSKPIQESAGTATSLKFGENSAVLRGRVKGQIGGAEWAGKEK